MDKPPPYNPRRGPPHDLPDYYPEGGRVYPQETLTSNNLTGQIFNAYKVNPILIGMIVLLLTILGAVGWYATRNDDRIYGYIALRDRREHDLWDRLVEMSLKCRDKEIDPGPNYPLPQFPPLTGGGTSFTYPQKPSRAP